MKQSKPQVVTERLDPATEQYRQDIFNRGREVSNQPYTPYNGQTVAGPDALSKEGVTGMRDAQGQLANVGQMNLNAYERAMMSGQELNNLGFGMQRQSGQLGGLAGGFDQQGQNMAQWGQQFSPYMNAGQNGARALGGDQAATQALMNPYQSQVLDAVGADFDKQRAAAHTQSNQAATQAGAFGGDRHAIMEGARLGELDSAQMATMANLRQGGFNDAMGRAGQAANLGLGAGQMDLSGRQVGQDFNRLGMDARGLGAQYDQMGMGARGMGLQAQNMGLGALNQAGQAAQGQAGIAGQLFGAGDYFRGINQAGLDSKYNQFLEQRDWGLRNFDVLKSGMNGMPYGQQQETPMQRNAGAGILGGAATGAQIGSVIPGVGTAIGALGGGLLGMFG